MLILWQLRVCFTVVLACIIWLENVEVAVVKIEKVVKYLSAVEQTRSFITAVNVVAFLAPH